MGLSDFLFPKKTMVSLDLGSRYLKVACFNIVGKQPIMTHFEMAKTPSGAMSKGGLIEGGLIQKELHNTVRKINYKKNFKTLLSIGGPSVMTRKLNIVQSDEPEIRKENIHFEAEQYLPFDIQDSEYVTIDLPSDDPNSNTNSVFFIAVHNNTLNTYHLCMSGVSVKVNVIYPAVLALRHTVLSSHKKSFENSNEFSLLLDVGFQTTGFYVLKGEYTVFSRELFTGTSLFAASIQKRMSVSEAEALNLLDAICKNQPAPDEALEAVQERESVFFREMALGVEYFLNYFTQAKIAKGYVTGGGSHIPGLSSELSRRMGIPIQDLQVFRSIRTKGFSKKKIQEIQSFSGICVGLALSQFQNK